MKLEIDVHHYHHYPMSNETHDQFKIVNEKLDSIMNKQEKFDASLEVLNAATNDIAQDMETLKQEIANGTVSDESLAKLDVNANYLKSLGASVENPIPTPEPVPTPEPTPNPPVEPTPEV